MSSFPLREKTVVLFGSFGSLTQNLALTLTGQGADVAIVDAEADKAQRFCQNVNDYREGNDKLGRATAIACDMKSYNDVSDAISKAAQIYGGIDVFIDTLSVMKATPLTESWNEDGFVEMMQKNLKASMMASHYVANLYKGRKKGRILFVLNFASSQGSTQDLFGAAIRGGLMPFSKALARELSASHVTVNCLQIGLTEEYLLGHFPDASSMNEAADKMRQLEPMMKIIEPEKISQAILFLVGPSGAAFTGQVLNLG